MWREGKLWQNNKRGPTFIKQVRVQSKEKRGGNYSGEKATKEQILYKEMRQLDLHCLVSMNQIILQLIQLKNLLHTINLTNVDSCIVVITTHKDTNIQRQQTPFCRCRAIDIACHISLSNIQCFPVYCGFQNDITQVRKFTNLR